MEFFKYNTLSSDKTDLISGEVINNIEKSMWVERYRDVGEFSFEASASSGLIQFLPIGTIISHVDTMELMIVENHEINENMEEATITISGRSFASALENRPVGLNAARQNSIIAKYDMVADYIPNQIVKLINDHIVVGTTWSTNDAWPHVTAQNKVGNVGTNVARTIEFGNIFERLLELLVIDDLGIRSVRKDTFGLGGSLTDIQFFIYKGIDKTSTVMFDWTTGDLKEIQYLFSNKNLKDAALVIGQYMFVAVQGTPIGWDRRYMIVDGTDIDGDIGASPVGAQYTAIQNIMITRGNQAIASQKNITITQADTSETIKYQYRKDYNMGDLVLLNGNHGQVAIMRVIEYAEIEDENGESGHPTLALLGA